MMMLNTKRVMPPLFPALQPLQMQSECKRNYYGPNAAKTPQDPREADQPRLTPYATVVVTRVTMPRTVGTPSHSASSATRSATSRKHVDKNNAKTVGLVAKPLSFMADTRR